MHRTIAALTIAAALTFGAAGPAAAGPIPRLGYPPLKPVMANGHAVQPCVTTTWRSQAWHRPKTRVGATCYATPDMWVSRYWPRVGTVTTPLGRSLPVYLRTV